LGDHMPAVGREFGSPDFERLMAEDHRLCHGVFDPALREGLEAPGHPWRAEIAETREEPAPRDGTGVARSAS
jgi:hypothetical protein